MKITAEKEWLIKRIALSASYFFGSSVKQRRYIQGLVEKSSAEVSNGEGIRQILRITKPAWKKFEEEFARAGTVVRDHNPNYPYHRVQLAEGEADTAASEFDNLNSGDYQGSGSGAAGGVPQSVVDQLQRDIERLNRDLYSERQYRTAAELAVEKAKSQLREAVENRGGPVTVKVETILETRTITRAHKTMPELLARVAAGLNVYLVGPAGSGKTTGAEQVADGLGLQFGFMSVGPQTTKSDIFGFMNAAGTYVTTEFRRRYEEGGIFLFDEIDAANPGVLTSVNAALAGSLCSFPDKMVKRHPDFRCLAAGNTFGTGPDRVYVGRQELDGASLDRFDFLEWGYDEGLELDIAKGIWPDNLEVVTKWTSFVQQVRKSVGKLGLRHVVSPRATINGIKALRQGIEWDAIVRTSVWKNLKPADIDRVKANITA